MRTPRQEAFDPTGICPNGPDPETGDWPCDPKPTFGGGWAECAVCGRQGPYHDASLLAEAAVEREAHVRSIERLRQALIEVYSDLSHPNPQVESAREIAREALEVVAPPAREAKPNS